VKTCGRKGCGRPVKARDLCASDYAAALRKGEIQRIRSYRRPAPKDGQVWCTSCKQYRPEADFRWNQPRNNWDRSCRECKNVAYRRWYDGDAKDQKPDTPADVERRARRAAYMREWSSRNRDKVRLKATLRSWGLTEEQYFGLFERQDHRCAVCRTPQRPDRALAIDHCHETGRIRGLCCQDCNLGMGQFADDPDLLEAAARYLRAGGVVHDEELRVTVDSHRVRRTAIRDAERARVIEE
jgi:hypothetical protein